ncbi:hypothetical protein JX265_006350 [Neoarthrinium moseri]|uniref:Uncharacterized protein n=1 Tax=Neoarthrinium moseri TaxID=1658444 RepID=A0A9P9WM20_9PEZI|nr:uncharacterized protein JN550_008260 [Neoarthrinium moseri]KAI1865503.1 hypothetical protein JN550_008260 [Neoarthrinium moseri]KAI1870180.1 hypothetical protein JX265_006350 [Neoarthrinium moseri]
MHYIFIHNKSGKAQEFQVHGFNGDKNITVAPRTKAKIEAPDGKSGAIIAVHEGQIGEQAEITKNGWGGNDTVDISNICGAGGNMTVQQVGDAPNKFKGDQIFMQECNTAWHKASQDVKNAIKSHVFLDSKGNVKRIGAPKENQALEKFVRTFAQGKTYIGVGAWGNSKGDPGDNAQSSAGKGNKDILVTYSDGDASPEVPKANVRMAAVVNEVKEVAEPAGDISVASAEPSGDISVASAEPAGEFSVAAASNVQALKPGIVLYNKGNKEETYYFYDNYWNGNGTAGANFDHPLKNVKLAAGKSTHVPLDLKFKGRVQKGTQLPATWAEFQVRADNDGKAHGDISLQQGCDCAAEIASTDGTNVRNGFSKDILKDAPAAAIRKKPNGEKALDTTVGNWNGPANQATIDYEYKVLGHGKAYITGGTGVPDIASKNNCLAVTFY